MGVTARDMGRGRTPEQERYAIPSRRWRNATAGETGTGAWGEIKYDQQDMGYRHSRRWRILPLTVLPFRLSIASENR